jgi:lipopolysaccharide transport system permease protein
MSPDATARAAAPMPGMTPGNASHADDGDWDLVIRPRASLLGLNPRELWRYRDIIPLFVRRDFVTAHIQTLFGPLLYFVHPIITVAVYTLLFGTLANIPTDGVPAPLFYLAGILCWSYFGDCVTRTSSAFRDNVHLFGKIYFPRLLLPLSMLVSNLVRFAAQAILLAAVMIVYAVRGTDFALTPWVALVPVLIVLIAGLGLGVGLIVSSLSVRYRDLSVLLGSALQLLMYATPVIYPLSAVPRQFAWAVAINPMTPIVEGMRRALYGIGSVSAGSLVYSAGVIIVLVAMGLVAFARAERDFVDTL